MTITLHQAATDGMCATKGMEMGQSIATASRSEIPHASVMKSNVERREARAVAKNVEHAAERINTFSKATRDGAEIPTVVMGDCRIATRTLEALRTELESKGYTPLHGNDFFEAGALSPLELPAANMVLVTMSLGFSTDDKAGAKIVPAPTGCTE